MANNIFSIKRYSQRKSHQQTLTRTSQPYNRMTEIARTTTDIMPNQTGRVRYLSTEWNACSVDNSFIPAGTRVRPIMRRGNTWYVAADAEAQTQQAA
jgi:membrane protein implicated in regulation of membrane protease activity